MKESKPTGSLDPNEMAETFIEVARLAEVLSPTQDARVRISE